MRGWGGALFAGTGGLLAWTWVGYLAFLRLLVRLRPPARTAPDETQACPFVAVVVVAYNEERVIGDKIANSLALDWPSDRLQVLVASDGSSDRTNEIVSSHPSPSVKLVARSRRGPALMSNEAVEACEADWLLFTDAETRLERDVLRQMGRHFQDPLVGMVDGALVSANSDASSIASDVGIYWRVESMLKAAESALGSLSSTFGACSAVRRSIFEPLAASEDVDFRTPLDGIARGYRIVHEPGARAYEVGHSDVRSQFRARVRMVTKNLPGTLRHMRGPVARKPLVMLGIVSHKLLRWTTPFLLVANLAGALSIRSRPAGRAALAAHGAFWLAGAAGGLAFRAGRQIPVASSVFSFLVVIAGFALGVVNSVRRVQIATYDPSRELGR